MTWGSRSTQDALHAHRRGPETPGADLSQSWRLDIHDHDAGRLGVRGSPPPRCPSSRRALAWRDKEYVLVPSRRSRPPRNLTTSKRSHARGGASGATDWLRGDSFRRRLWARGGHRAPCASQSPPHTCHIGLHCPCRVESPRPDPGRDPAGGAPSVLLAMRKSHASEPRVS